MKQLVQIPMALKMLFYCRLKLEEWIKNFKEKKEWELKLWAAGGDFRAGILREEGCLYNRHFIFSYLNCFAPCNTYSYYLPAHGWGVTTQTLENKSVKNQTTNEDVCCFNFSLIVEMCCTLSSHMMVSGAI